MEPKLVLFGGTSNYGLLSDGYTVPEIGTNLPAGWHHYRLLPPSCCCLLSCVQLTYFVKSVSVSMSHDLVIYHPILFFSSLDFMGSTWQNREEKSRSQITISFLPLSAVCCSGVTVVRQGAQASGHTKPGFDGANIEGGWPSPRRGSRTAGHIELGPLNTSPHLQSASASSPQVFKSMWDFTIAKFKLAATTNLLLKSYYLKNIA